MRAWRLDEIERAACELAAKLVAEVEEMNPITGSRSQRFELISTEMVATARALGAWREQQQQQHVGDNAAPCMAWHATPQRETLDAIATDGLAAAGDLLLGSGELLPTAHGARYGSGIYTSPCLELSDTYGFRDASDTRQALLVLVAPGRLRRIPDETNIVSAEELAAAQRVVAFREAATIHAHVAGMSYNKLCRLAERCNVAYDAEARGFRRGDYEVLRAALAGLLDPHHALPTSVARTLRAAMTWEELFAEPCDGEYEDGSSARLSADGEQLIVASAARALPLLLVTYRPLKPADRRLAPSTGKKRKKQVKKLNRKVKVARPQLTFSCLRSSRGDELWSMALTDRGAMRLFSAPSVATPRAPPAAAPFSLKLCFVIEASALMTQRRPSAGGASGSGSAAEGDSALRAVSLPVCAQLMRRLQPTSAAAIVYGDSAAGDDDDDVRRFRFGAVGSSDFFSPGGSLSSLGRRGRSPEQKRAPAADVGAALDAALTICTEEHSRAGDAREVAAVAGAARAAAIRASTRFTAVEQRNAAERDAQRVADAQLNDELFVIIVIGSGRARRGGSSSSIDSLEGECIHRYILCEILLTI